MVMPRTKHFCLEGWDAQLGLPVGDSRINALSRTRGRPHRRRALMTGVPHRRRSAARPSIEGTCARALAIPPPRRYSETKGGPGILDNRSTCLRTHSADAPEDVRTFLDCHRVQTGLILPARTLTARTTLPAHPVLQGPRPFSRPLYDVASVLPYYRTSTSKRVTLSMKLGGEYRPAAISGDINWRRCLSEELHVNSRMP